MKKKRSIPVFSLFPRYISKETGKKVANVKTASRLFWQKKLRMKKDIFEAGKITGKKRARYKLTQPRAGVLALLSKEGVLFKEFKEKKSVYIPKKYSKIKSAFLFPTIYDALMFMRGTVGLQKRKISATKSIVRMTPKINLDIFKKFMFLKAGAKIFERKRKVKREIPEFEKRNLDEFIKRDKSKRILYHRILQKYDEEKLRKMYFSATWQDLYDLERALAQNHIQIPEDTIYPHELEFVVNFNVDVIRVRKNSVDRVKFFTPNFYFFADVGVDYLTSEIINYYLYSDFVENHEKYITGVFIFVIAFSEADAKTLEEEGVAIGKKILEETGASEVRFAIYTINELTFAKRREKKIKEEVEEEEGEQTLLHEEELSEDENKEEFSEGEDEENPRVFF